MSNAERQWFFRQRQKLRKDAEKNAVAVLAALGDLQKLREQEPDVWRQEGVCPSCKRRVTDTPGDGCLCEFAHEDWLTPWYMPEL